MESFSPPLGGYESVRRGQKARHDQDHADDHPRVRRHAREQVVLNLPARVLCREDCAGLCETCGANKNLSPCGCVSETIDPRWQALKGLVDG